MATKQVQTKKTTTEKKKKKAKVSVPNVKVMVNSTYNNTIVSITDYSGNVISYSSAGLIGFKGSKKSTAYAATKTGEDAAMKAVQSGAREAEVLVKGVGIGRQAAVKGIRSAGLRITTLLDRTPVQHGGTKPRKKPKK